MATRVNPKLIDDLQVFGAEDVSKCYHCGNCTATCPFSKEPYIFPRRSMRFLQMGLEKKLEGSLEPWLCYYCGECSDDCPREAEPGETMMSLRRWLTSRYDWTGISRLFYRSGKLELIHLIFLASRFLSATGCKPSTRRKYCCAAFFVLPPWLPLNIPIVLCFNPISTFQWGVFLKTRLS